MFSNNLSYEFKLLTRNKWLFTLIIIITFLFTFATYNGNKNVAKRLVDIKKTQKQLQQEDSLMLAQLAKIERDEKINLPAWRLPSAPMTIGHRHPRLAIMQPQKLSFLATGQSDMYTHFKRPRAYGNNFALDYSEMVNPIQLLFGNFDITFVLIYILPLLIIAFTFNVLSKEKELGTLRLLAAQPISIAKWLLQKMAIRYCIFTAITLISLLLIIAIFSLNAFSNISGLIALLLLVSGYILFWFVTSVIINIKINNSSKNAFALIAVWLLIVLILPATINQIGHSLYPTPSRLQMINEIRLIKKENEEKQNEIIDDYLRTHPELAKGSDKDKFGFWHNYFASEKVLEEKTKPLLAKYDLQLQKQQKLISWFQYISPAILMQQSLNNIAGTSEKHYNDYKKQVFEFSKTWRNYFVPMLFKGEKFTTKHYNKLPKFTYKNRVSNNVWLNFMAILLISGFAFLILAKNNFKNNAVLN